MQSEHIASYHHVLLTKHSFPVRAFAYPVRKRFTKKGPDPFPEDEDVKELRECADEALDKTTPGPARSPEVWEQHERDGHMPKLPDCPICAEEHGSVVHHFARSSSSLHTLHLDTGYWGDISLDGKRYFAVAGLRVQHEDMVILVLFCIPIENKSGLAVSQEVFQLIDYSASCKQLQAFHGSKVLVNQDFERHAAPRAIYLSTSPAHQPQSNGEAEDYWLSETVYKYLHPIYLILTGVLQ